MKPLSLAAVEHLAHALARAYLTFNEPIPDFSSRFPDRLEACLAAPFATFQKKELYPGLAKKAAILFYLLIKDHPFENGNKRIAVTALLTFLYLNKSWMKAPWQDLYTLATFVASSPPRSKDSALKILEAFIRDHLEKR